MLGQTGDTITWWLGSTLHEHKLIVYLEFYATINANSFQGFLSGFFFKTECGAQWQYEFNDWDFIGTRGRFYDVTTCGSASH